MNETTGWVLALLIVVSFGLSWLYLDYTTTRKFITAGYVQELHAGVSTITWVKPILKE